MFKAFFFLYQCSFKRSVESRRRTGLEIESKEGRRSAQNKERSEKIR